MPLVAFRVAKMTHEPFDGTGAAWEGGRWNSPGRPVVYASRRYACALLEILTRADRQRLPGAHHAIAITVPDDVAVERIDPAGHLGWDEPESSVARTLGDRWLAERRTAVLVVPSAVARPFEENVLINPRHPDAERLARSVPVAVRWDARLFQSTR